MKTKNRTLVLFGVLVSSLVAGLLALGGGASASTGVGQEVHAILNLATNQVDAPLTECTETGCGPIASVPAQEGDDVDLGLVYTYTPTSVNQAPDVTTRTGLLKDLTGTLAGCNGKYGVAIVATNGVFTSSGGSLRVGDDQVIDEDPKTLPNTPSVARAYCLP